MNQTGPVKNDNMFNMYKDYVLLMPLYQTLQLKDLQSPQVPVCVM